MELRCSRCGQIMESTQKECPNCGTVLSDKNGSGDSWRPVSLPEGLVDEGINSAKDDVGDDEHKRASVQLNGGVRLADRSKVAAGRPVAISPKIMVIVVGIIAGLAVVGGAIAALSSLAANHQDFMYVGWPYAPMYEDTNLTLPIATLQRGEAVVFLGKEGQFVKIRDLDGKIGYLQQNHLVPTQPKYIKDAQFYGCKQYLSEDSNKPCLTRASQQFKACNEYCSSDISGQCLAKCQEQMVSCQAKCGQ